MSKDLPVSSAVTFSVHDLSNLRTGKSVNLLRELTSSWSAKPVCVKYSLRDDCDFVDTGNGASPPEHATSNQTFCSKIHKSSSSDGTSVAETSSSKMSNLLETRMNHSRTSIDDNWTKKRTQLLRKCTEYLELESANSKYTKETFRRGFLNKVSSFFYSPI